MTKKYLTIGAGGLALLLVFTYASMHWTSRSEFCNNCHYMEPFYHAWETSSHSDVECVTCHYEPGLMSTFEGKLKGLEQLFSYATQSYRRGKPWAEIPDASCLRSGCHEERLLKGKAEYKEGIVFDHTPHLTQMRRGKKLRCTSCHSQIVQGEHITVTSSTCFLCHFKGLDSEASPSCTQCHDAPVATDGQTVSYDHTMVVDRGVECQKCHGQMVIGDGAVPRTNCEACHFEQRLLDEYENTDELHRMHITENKIECQRCHLDIQHKSVSRTEEIKPDCRSCHSEFHEAQEMLFRGRGGKHAESHPSPMFTGGLNCQGCHIFHQSMEEFSPAGETVVAREQSCDYCHGPGYGDLVEAWTDSTDRRLEIIRRSIDRVESELADVDTTSGAGRQAAVNLRDAKYNYQLVEYGKAVHNITYADRLLEASRRLLITALDQVGSDHSLPEYPWTDQIVPGECASCHDGIAEATVETSDGLRFSHGSHLELDALSCRECHSNMRRHGELVMPKQDCLSCHHQTMALERGTQCENCHETQKSVFSGTALGAGMPDIMYEAGLECSQCHLDAEGEEIVRSGAAACETCHGEGYGDLLAMWRESTESMLTQLEELISRADGVQLTGSRRETLERARRIRDLFASDGSRGAHNSMLAEEYLADAVADLEEMLPES